MMVKNTVQWKKINFCDASGYGLMVAVMTNLGHLMMPMILNL